MSIKAIDELFNALSEKDVSENPFLTPELDRLKSKFYSTYIKPISKTNLKKSETMFDLLCDLMNSCKKAGFKTGVQAGIELAGGAGSSGIKDKEEFASDLSRIENKFAEIMCLVGCLSCAEDIADTFGDGHLETALHGVARLAEEVFNEISDLRTEFENL